MSQTNYLNVYYSRLNHMGNSTAQRIRNGGIRSFYKWLAESPHTVRELSVERGIYFDGIILTSKDKEYQKIMFLNVSNDTPLCVGDIITWPLQNGTEEKWIIIQEEKKVNGTYRTFWIVRCNYLMKWVDGKGHVQQSWSYFVSSLDSKIKGNFRTWNSLISPQPNKYAEILMPRYPIDRATNFIVEEESWTVVEYDHTSVPGIIYLSLTEGKINSIYDDVPNDLADTDKIAKYELLVPNQKQQVSVGQKFTPAFTLTKNGIPCDQPVQFSSTNPAIMKVQNNELIAISKGEVDIIVTLINYPTIYQTLQINVSNEQTFSAYIEGPDKIRLDRDGIYTLIGTQNLIGEVIFTIDKNTPYAKIDDKYNDSISCKVHANDKNILKDVILQAEYNGTVYTKTISIIPLW